MHVVKQRKYPLIVVRKNFPFCTKDAGELIFQFLKK